MIFVFVFEIFILKLFAIYPSSFTALWRLSSDSLKTAWLSANQVVFKTVHNMLYYNIQTANNTGVLQKYSIKFKYLWTRMMNQN